MKQLLITIAAVVLVGCGNGIKHPPLVKAIEKENFETVKQLLTDGRNVNIKFGKFETNTYSEYARRIILTIASNYKLKNPDVLWAPAALKGRDNAVQTQEDLDKLLEQIKANNV